jgi:hypothetical protein
MAGYQKRRQEKGLGTLLLAEIVIHVILIRLLSRFNGQDAE